MQSEVLTDRLNRVLKLRVVPKLGRIGFDDQLCWTLFTMTASAWELIERFGDNIELIHPDFTAKLREIRRGILSYSRKKSEAISILGEMDPQTTFSLINKSMDPAKLCDDLQNISLSWIILPRAYDLF